MARQPNRELRRDTGDSSSVERALDCWCHGAAHLMAVLGPEEALRIIARTVAEILDVIGEEDVVIPEGTFSDLDSGLG